MNRFQKVNRVARRVKEVMDGPDSKGKSASELIKLYASTPFVFAWDFTQANELVAGFPDFVYAHQQSVLAGCAIPKELLVGDTNTSGITVRLPEFSGHFAELRRRL